jgi:hypothetical protein
LARHFHDSFELAVRRRGFGLPSSYPQLMVARNEQHVSKSATEEVESSLKRGHVIGHVAGDHQDVCLEFDERQPIEPTLVGFMICVKVGDRHHAERAVRGRT